MGMNAGQLNRRIQLLRASYTENGAGEMIPTWQNHGVPIFAQRRDVSDAERMRAGAWDNLLVVRFSVRASTFAQGIRRSDRLVHEGVTYQIDGIKEAPSDRSFLEITAKTEETL